LTSEEKNASVKSRNIIKDNVKKWVELSNALTIEDVTDMITLGVRPNFCEYKLMHQHGKPVNAKITVSVQIK